MLTTYNDAYKTWIFAKNSDFPEIPVARFLDFVINPETGVFEAMWTEGKDGQKLLALKDIRQWNANEIMISDENELMAPSNFPKLQIIMDKEVPILGALVFSKDKYLGKATDFAFDTVSPRLFNIHVFSGFWIFGTKLIIPKTKILKITAEGITVSDEKVKSEEAGSKNILEIAKKKVPEIEKGIRMKGAEVKIKDKK